MKRNWQVKIALRSGQLQLRLNGATSPLTKRFHLESLPLKQRIAIKATSAQEESASDEQSATWAGRGNFHVKHKLKPEAGFKVGFSGAKAKKEQNTTRATSTIELENKSVKRILVHGHGGENAPVWSFECTQSKDYLIGLFDEDMADLDVEDESFFVSGKVTTVASDIHLIHVDSLEYEVMKDIKKVALQALLRKLIFERYQSNQDLANCVVRSR